MPWLPGFGGEIQNIDAAEVLVAFDDCGEGEGVGVAMSLRGGCQREGQQAEEGRSHWAGAFFFLVEVGCPSMPCCSQYW